MNCDICIGHTAESDEDEDEMEDDEELFDERTFDVEQVCALPVFDAN